MFAKNSEGTKRRTKNLPNTNDPKWNQTFVYSVRKSELKYKSLEVTVWDNVKYGANDFLGETILELTYLNEKPQWYYLHAHDERRHIGYVTQSYFVHFDFYFGVSPRNCKAKNS